MPCDTRAEATDIDMGIPENPMKSTISASSLGSKSKAPEKDQRFSNKV